MPGRGRSSHVRRRAKALGAAADPCAAALHSVRAARDELLDFGTPGEAYPPDVARELDKAVRQLSSCVRRRR